MNSDGDNDDNDDDHDDVDDGDDVVYFLDISKSKIGSAKPKQAKGAIKTVTKKPSSQISNSNKKKLYNGLLVLEGSNGIPTLLVGRNSKQNERISFEIAQDHHLWFHVQVCFMHLI